MDGVVLRLMPAPGDRLKPAHPEELVKVSGGQGTINVNSWSPDSKKFAYCGVREDVGLPPRYRDLHQIARGIVCVPHDAAVVELH